MSGLDRRRWLTVSLAGYGASLAGCRLSEPTRPTTGGFAGPDSERGHRVRDRGPFLAPQKRRRTDVLIAGGGIAGLAAARALRQRGIDDFALLELEDSLGGNSRGGAIGGVECPWGAHYLPVPGDDASEVQDFLEELGLRRRVAGRWQYDERHLCHSPQERLFFEGHWQDGLLPMAGVGPGTLAQYRRFAQLVDDAQAQGRFAIPAFKTPWGPYQRRLDAMTFTSLLDEQGLDDALLRWYLDYCCRDDYGAGIDTVSAWAGLHYFASRHGFQVPGHEQDAREGGVLTWPDGNATLSRALMAGLGDRAHPGCSVLRIEVVKHGVELDVFRHGTAAVERWHARHCVVALPVFVAARVIEHPPAAVMAAARHLQYAPWVVTNLHVQAPLWDRPGAAPAWDNVIHTPLQPGRWAGSAGLGYVDARHQTLDPRPGPTVLTHYRALGGTLAQMQQARRQLLQQSWQQWRDFALAELVAAHPDLPGKLTGVEVIRYGHAMGVPVPGTLDSLRKIDPFGNNHGTLLLSKKERLSFAHSDWSGYSIFEEAFTRGHRAGSTISP